MDKIRRAHAANLALNTEEFTDALTELKEQVSNSLLASCDRDERDDRWQEYNGLIRVEMLLAKWASGVRHKKEVKNERHSGNGTAND